MGEWKFFMRKSAVYFLVALTLISLALTSVPSAFSQTDQTQNIKILSYSYYVDNQGILDVVGEVQNTGTSTVTTVILTGSIIDSNGADQADSYTEIGVVPMPVTYLNPGQIAPFYMEFFQPKESSDGSWGTVYVSSVHLAVAQANATDNYQYPNLTVANSNSYIGSTASDTGVYWVAGDVENTGSQTAQNITVFGTFYNSTGSVVAVGYSATDPNLAPSTEDSFKLGAFDINQTGIVTEEKITKYSLLIQADGPLLQGTAPAVSSSPNVTNSPPPTQPTTVNSNSNKSSNATVIYALIVAVILIAAAAALLFLRKSKPFQTAKQAKKARKKQDG